MDCKIMILHVEKKIENFKAILDSRTGLMGKSLRRPFNSSPQKAWLAFRAIRLVGGGAVTGGGGRTSAPASREIPLYL